MSSSIFCSLFFLCCVRRKVKKRKGPVRRLNSRCSLQLFLISTHAVRTKHITGSSSAPRILCSSHMIKPLTQTITGSWQSGYCKTGWLSNGKKQSYITAQRRGTAGKTNYIVFSICIPDPYNSLGDRLRNANAVHFWNQLCLSTRKHQASFRFFSPANALR